METTIIVNQAAHFYYCGENCVSIYFLTCFTFEEGDDDDEIVLQFPSLS